MHSPRAVVRPRTAASAAGRTGISPSSRSASPSSVPTERWRSNHNRGMKGPASLCARHRSPSEIVRHAVWLCQRSNPTNRGGEDLSAERGISDSQESIGLWSTKSGSEFANRLKLRHTGCGETFFGDEVVPKVNGKQHFPEGRTRRRARGHEKGRRPGDAGLVRDERRSDRQNVYWALTISCSASGSLPPSVSLLKLASSAPNRIGFTPGVMLFSFHWTPPNST